MGYVYGVYCYTDRNKKLYAGNHYGILTILLLRQKPRTIIKVLSGCELLIQRS